MISSQPALTAILMMPFSFDRLAGCVARLRRQTIHDHIEVVLVHSPAYAHEIDPSNFKGFYSFQAIAIQEGFTSAEGFAVGFAHTSAPVVAYIEDHVFLEPQWAEIIMEAHDGPWAAVAPAMENGCAYASLSGRANHLACFLDWYGHEQRCEVRSGPGHNTTYKRAVLNPLKDQLAEHYNSERNLGYLLESQGHRMIIQPRAVTRHVNISKFRAAFLQSYYGGKIFGAQRARSMGGLEKAGRTCLSPLVPPLRMARIVKALHERGKLAEIGFWQLTPHLSLLLLAHAVGETLGYWHDSSQAEAIYRTFELNRWAVVTPEDQALLMSVTHD